MASAVIPFNLFGVCGVINWACGVPVNMADAYNREVVRVDEELCGFDLT
jgi:hypothetical protein